jgi:pilus assembly protein Flp/PilA
VKLGLPRSPVGLGSSSHAPIVFHSKKGKTSMRQLGQFMVEFLKAEDGPTAVEYAVMLALIIVVCLVAITALGTSANATFGTVGNKIGAAGS